VREHRQPFPARRRASLCESRALGVVSRRVRARATRLPRRARDDDDDDDDDDDATDEDEDARDGDARR